MKALALVLLFAGFTCLSVGVYQIWLRNDPNRLAFQNYNYGVNTSVNAKDLPRRIIIKNLHIDLPIIPATVTKNAWQTTQDGASYLMLSPIPGKTGNSIIYAHNWASLFGNLVAAKSGEQVEVDFADKSKKTFVIEKTMVVSPNDAKILASSNEKKLTLYTCTGWFDSKRFVVIAVLKGVSSK